MFLQEHVGTRQDGSLHTILRRTGSPWAGKSSYSFGKNVILAESLQQPFSGGGSLWRRSFLLIEADHELLELGQRILDLSLKVDECVIELDENRRAVYFALVLVP